MHFEKSIVIPYLTVEFVEMRNQANWSSKKVSLLLIIHRNCGGNFALFLQNLNHHIEKRFL